MFATGCSDLPITGFERPPQIEFDHSSSLPTASTCAPILRLPVLREASTFTENMKLAILGSFGFGCV